MKQRAELGARLAERRILHGKREGGALFGARCIALVQLLVDRADGGLRRRTRTDAREALRACAVGDGDDGDVADRCRSEPIVAVRRIVLVLLAAHTRRDEVRRADLLLLGHVLGRGVRLVLRHGMVLPERRRVQEQLLLAQGRRRVIWFGRAARRFGRDDLRRRTARRFGRGGLRRWAARRFGRDGRTLFEANLSQGSRCKLFSFRQDARTSFLHREPSLQENTPALRGRP